MTTPSDAVSFPLDAPPPAPSSLDRPGSAARAFLAWRTAATATLLVWIGLLLLASSATTTSDGWDELGWVALVIITYAVAVAGVIPAYVFTVGRWLDRRTAPRGTTHSAFVFGLQGFGFGVLISVPLVVDESVTMLGLAAFFLAPILVAAAGRLLVELRGPVWSAVFWATFVLAMVPALYMLVVQVALGGFAQSA